MKPLAEVQRFVLSSVPRLTPRGVPLRDALGLVLAEAVRASEPVPPFANSAMDGYAVRAADVASATTDSPVILRVVDELPAGRPPTVPVGVGEAIRIMTGAPFPDGADAIVMVELTERIDGATANEIGHVRIVHPAAVGDHVRRAGGDLDAGQLVFEAGTVLGAAHLGVLASLGVAVVRAVPRARVGVLSTGDELVAIDQVLAPGQIRDSNRPMLLAMLERTGCEPVDLGKVHDDEDAIAAVVERGLAECDAVLTSGGVSVGDFDYMRAVLDRLGDMHWFQVAIKPSKPFAFGLCRGVPVFGLPGNPVSSHVSFELFAGPGLRHMMGQARPYRPQVRAVAAAPMRRRPDGKLHLDRVVVEWDVDSQRFTARRSGDQASNVLSAMALANALALLPDGEGVETGDDVEVMLLDLPTGLAAPSAWAESGHAGHPLGNDC